MRQAVSTRFPNQAKGETIEYRDDTRQSTLAYLDYSADGATASVTVFTVWNGRSRIYGYRPAKKAEAIVERHLNTEGYTSVTGEEGE
jgi:hypothetical protein